MDQCEPVPQVPSMSWPLALAPISWLLAFLLTPTSWLLVPLLTPTSWLLVPLLAARALADYPYYTDYNSVYARAAVANLSTAKVARRTFDFSGEEPYKLTITPSLIIPLPDLASSLTIRLPYTWQFGGQAGEETARRVAHSQDR